MTIAPPPTPLTLDVLLFASLAEAFGCSSIPVALEAGDTVGRLREVVLADPRATLAAGHVRVAVNHAFAADDLALRPGDEVALIPPVAGG